MELCALLTFAESEKTLLSISEKGMCLQILDQLGAHGKIAKTLALVKSWSVIVSALPEQSD